MLLACGSQARAQSGGFEARRDTVYEKMFRQDDGWTGGDAAYSVPLGGNKTLWLFGDTFVGEIRHGVRRKFTMVRNSAAWQRLDGGAPQFFVSGTDIAPKPIFEARERGAYYWPSDGIVLGDKLAIFMKRVTDKAEVQEGFNFDWAGEDLALVSNPSSPPNQWNYRLLPVPGAELTIMPGAACLSDDKYVYVYGTVEKSGAPRDCVLMRIAGEELSRGDLSAMQYWVRKRDAHGMQANEGMWSESPLYLLPVFSHGAPEMSVSKVNGTSGFWAVYSPDGLSDKIVVRHAARPEGPWSEAIGVYTVPEAADKTLLCYGAKGHAEFLLPPREMLVTFCLNPGGIKSHIMRPDVYFPKCLRVKFPANFEQLPTTAQRVNSEVSAGK